MMNRHVKAQLISTSIVEVIAENGIPFRVRVAREGSEYGLNNCLIAEQDMIEFYDARFINHKDAAKDEHGNLLGQFVSRYNLHTLMESKNGRRGINLEGGVPVWTIDGDAIECAFNLILTHDEVLEYVTKFQ